MGGIAADFEMPAPDGFFRRFQRGRDRGAVEIPVEIRLRDGPVYRFGEGEPGVRLLVNDRRGWQALNRMDELGICEAYMDGGLEIEGDILGFISLRRGLRDHHPLHLLWGRLAPWLRGRVAADRRAIAAHYDLESEFFLKFLDPSRCYSQAVFASDDEPLEAAQRRKLDFAISACRIAPGDRVLDVGGGWGSFTEHAGRRGIQVTSLTISRASEEFLRALIQRAQLPCRVLNENFLRHQTSTPYDAVVILGVMEHLPRYPAVLRQLVPILKPGGRVYIDASAMRTPYAKPSFIARHIFPSDHRFLCLHEFLGAVAKSPLELIQVYNDRHNYYLTCKAWAENLDAARHDLIRRWGEASYRRFRLYLWGSAYAFLSRNAEAFRVILEHPLSH